MRIALASAALLIAAAPSAQTVQDSAPTLDSAPTTEQVATPIAETTLAPAADLSQWVDATPESLPPAFSDNANTMLAEESAGDTIMYWGSVAATAGILVFAATLFF